MKTAPTKKDHRSENMIENIDAFGQNSIRVKAGDKSVYIDPFKMQITPNDADFILLTHDHYDHFSPEDIDKVIGKNTILVIPEKMEGKVKEIADKFVKIVTVKPGASYEVDGLEFETVPAYNILKPFHPKSAGWVGYILKAGGKRIYIAGDTDALKEAKAVKCDIALVPIGGTYTMDAKAAAGLVDELEPEIAIPVHYGTGVGSPSDGQIFEENVKKSVKIEHKIRF